MFASTVSAETFYNLFDDNVEDLCNERRDRKRYTILGYIEAKRRPKTSVPDMFGVVNLNARRSREGLGTPVSVTRNMAPMIARALLEKIQDSGQSVDPKIVQIVHNDYAVTQVFGRRIAAMGTFKLASGVNGVDVVFKSHGRLIAIGRDGVKNVYVAKAGVTVSQLNHYLAIRVSRMTQAANTKRDYERAIQEALALITRHMGSDDAYLVDAHDRLVRHGAEVIDA
jgi:hypothetical protein